MRRINKYCKLFEAHQTRCASLLVEIVAEIKYNYFIYYVDEREYHDFIY